MKNKTKLITLFTTIFFLTILLALSVSAWCDTCSSAYDAGDLRDHNDAFYVQEPLQGDNDDWYKVYVDFTGEIELTIYDYPYSLFYKKDSCSASWDYCNDNCIIDVDSPQWIYFEVDSRDTGTYELWWETYTISCDYDGYCANFEEESTCSSDCEPCDSDEDCSGGDLCDINDNTCRGDADTGYGRIKVTNNYGISRTVYYSWDAPTYGQTPLIIPAGDTIYSPSKELVVGDHEAYIKWEEADGSMWKYDSSIKEVTKGSTKIFSFTIDPSGPYCGDGICSSSETHYDCPVDCVCEEGETRNLVCMGDDVAGEICNGGQWESNIQIEDCASQGKICDNGACIDPPCLDFGESCLADSECCTNICYEELTSGGICGECEYGDTRNLVCMGDNVAGEICNGGQWESNINIEDCAAQGKICDNGACIDPPSYCGDGVCDNGENISNCPEDCCSNPTAFWSVDDDCATFTTECGGEPLQNADIFVNLIKRGTTDSNGEFQYCGLSNGYHKWSAFYNDDHIDGGNDLYISWGTYTIHGFVTNIYDEPVQGAKVHFTSDSCTLSFPNYQYIDVTDNTGYYSINIPSYIDLKKVKITSPLNGPAYYEHYMSACNDVPTPTSPRYDVQLQTLGPETVCNDGNDNNNDGKTDCDDYTCVGTDVCNRVIDLDEFVFVKYEGDKSSIPFTGILEDDIFYNPDSEYIAARLKLKNVQAGDILRVDTYDSDENLVMGSYWDGSSYIDAYSYTLKPSDIHMDSAGITYAVIYKVIDVEKPEYLNGGQYIYGKWHMLVYVNDNYKATRHFIYDDYENLLIHKHDLEVEYGRVISKDRITQNIEVDPGNSNYVQLSYHLSTHSPIPGINWASHLPEGAVFDIYLKDVTLISDNIMFKPCTGGFGQSYYHDFKEEAYTKVYDLDSPTGGTLQLVRIYLPRTSQWLSDRTVTNYCANLYLDFNNPAKEAKIISLSPYITQEYLADIHKELFTPKNTDPDLQEKLLDLAVQDLTDSMAGEIIAQLEEEMDLQPVLDTAGLTLEDLEEYAVEEISNGMISKEDLETLITSDPEQLAQLVTDNILDELITSGVANDLLESSGLSDELNKASNQKLVKYVDSLDEITNIFDKLADGELSDAEKIELAESVGQYIFNELDSKYDLENILGSSAKVNTLNTKLKEIIPAHLDQLDINAILEGDVNSVVGGFINELVPELDAAGIDVTNILNGDFEQVLFDVSEKLFGKYAVSVEIIYKLVTDEDLTDDDIFAAAGQIGEAVFGAPVVIGQIFHYLVESHYIGETALNSVRIIRLYPASRTGYNVQVHSPVDLSLLNVYGNITNSETKLDKFKLEYYDAVKHENIYTQNISDLYTIKMDAFSEALIDVELAETNNNTIEILRFNNIKVLNNTKIQSRIQDGEETEIIVDLDSDGIFETSYNCSVKFIKEIACSNGLDDDGDSLIDCNDGDCECNERPRAYIKIKDEALVGEAITISSAGSLDFDGNITGYIWKVNGTILSNQPSFSTSLSEGLYYVALTVIDDNGENDTTTRRIAIKDSFIEKTSSGLSRSNTGINYNIVHDLYQEQNSSFTAYAKIKKNSDITKLKFIYLNNTDQLLEERTVDSQNANILEGSFTGDSELLLYENFISTTGRIGEGVFLIQLLNSTDGILDEEVYRIFNKPDYDSDEMVDLWEAILGLKATENDAQEDYDNDTLTNYFEYLYMTNPVVADSDNGGESDGSEYLAGRNLLDPSDDLADNDGDGFAYDTDCDDSNSNINPGATELCDGVDNDCDGSIDEGCSITNETIIINSPTNTIVTESLQVFNITTTLPSNCTLLLDGNPYNYESVSGNYWIEQEPPNITNCLGDWLASNPCSNIFDGDWNTYAQSDVNDGGSATYYATYFLPENHNSSKFRVKHKCNAIDNFNLPKRCWENRDNITIKLSIIPRTDSSYDSVSWRCQDEDGYQNAAVRWCNAIDPTVHETKMQFYINIFSKIESTNPIWQIDLQEGYHSIQYECTNVDGNTFVSETYWLNLTNPDCTDGQTQSCNTGLPGICSAGTQTCVNGSWDICIQDQTPTAEICGDGIDQDCDGQDLSCGNNRITYENFGITELKYADSSDWDSIIQDIFGAGYRVADWNDLKDYHNDGGDLLTLYDGLNLTEYGNSAFVTRNGDRTYSDTRYYFASRHEHTLPSNYLAHENIDNYLISLGSWYTTKQIMVFRITQPVDLNISSANYSPNPLIKGQDMNYNITVGYSGNEPINTSIGVSIDGYILGELPVYNLLPNQATSIIGSTPWGLEGDFDLGIYIDPNDLILEENESNNYYDFSITAQCNPEDCDNDGYISTAYGGDDCNDNNKEVHPGAEETCFTNDDLNCDGLIANEDVEGCVNFYRDDDQDGYGVSSTDYRCLCHLNGDERTYTSPTNGDCNDTNPYVSPDKVEICNNGLDDDCDGELDYDAEYCKMLIGEVGKISTDQLNETQWHTVNLANNYIDPVVIMQPITYNDAEPAHIRLTNIQSNQFDFMIEEWEYQDPGQHSEETVSYLVLESGTYELKNQTKIEVGKVVADENLKTVTFSQAFDKTPILLTQIQTINGPMAAITRQDSLTRTSFKVRTEEEDADESSGHKPEDIGYVAIEPYSDLRFEAAKTPLAVNDSWYDISFNSRFLSYEPFFLAWVETYEGGDSSNLRYKDLTTEGVSVKIQEDQSKDTETAHTEEVIAYLVLGEKEELWAEYEKFSRAECGIASSYFCNDCYEHGGRIRPGEQKCWCDIEARFIVPFADWCPRLLI